MRRFCRKSEFEKSFLRQTTEGGQRKWLYTYCSTTPCMFGLSFFENLKFSQAFCEWREIQSTSINIVHLSTNIGDRVKFNRGIVECFSISGQLQYCPVFLSNM